MGPTPGHDVRGRFTPGNQNRGEQERPRQECNRPRLAQRDERRRQRAEAHDTAPSTNGLATVDERG